MESFVKKKEQAEIPLSAKLIALEEQSKFRDRALMQLVERQQEELYAVVLMLGIGLSLVAGAVILLALTRRTGGAA